jgi:hypothetical protein
MRRSKKPRSRTAGDPDLGYQEDNAVITGHAEQIITVFRMHFHGPKEKTEEQVHDWVSDLKERKEWRRARPPAPPTG